MIAASSCQAAGRFAFAVILALVRLGFDGAMIASATQAHRILDVADRVLTLADGRFVEAAAEMAEGPGPRGTSLS